MFVYRIYELDRAGKVASRHDLSAETDSAEAIAAAQRLATNGVVELWRGSNLLATFRPRDVPSLPDQSARSSAPARG
jgi:hypothetical protein